MIDPVILLSAMGDLSRVWRDWPLAILLGITYLPAPNLGGICPECSATDPCATPIPDCNSCSPALSYHYTATFGNPSPAVIELYWVSSCTWTSTDGKVSLVYVTGWKVLDNRLGGGAIQYVNLSLPLCGPCGTYTVAGYPTITVVIS